VRPVAGPDHRLPLVLTFVFIRRRIVEGVAGTGPKG
jgi:hypothetical protein